MSKHEEQLVGYARTVMLMGSGFSGHLRPWLEDKVRDIARVEPSEIEQMKLVRFFVAEYGYLTEMPSVSEIAERFRETEEHYNDFESIRPPSDDEEYVEPWWLSDDDDDNNEYDESSERHQGRLDELGRLMDELMKAHPDRGEEIVSDWIRRVKELVDPSDEDRQEEIVSDYRRRVEESINSDEL